MPAAKKNVPARATVKQTPKTQATTARRGRPRASAAVTPADHDTVGSVQTQPAAPVREALFFDAHWYLSTYTDVQQAGVDAATHYREVGFREGRRPNAVFDGVSYLAVNPDLTGFEGDPFLHYVFFGAAEGRPLS